jgi:hypothetical protein
MRIKIPDPDISSEDALRLVKEHAEMLIHIAAMHGVVLTIERELDPLRPSEYKMRVDTRLTRQAQNRIK